jgi:uncharacterized phage protein (TIGR01671 family)
MKREIKFRAINALGEMIYGLPYTDEANSTIYYNEYNNRMCWRDEQGRHCNQPYKNGTLMQYTGLRDKHKREIYEGDILRNVDNPYVDYNPYIVFYNTREGGWMWRCTINEQEDILNQGIAGNGEVIGNIYEHSELLKEAD